MQRRSAVTIFVLAFLTVSALLARGATLKVNCDQHQTIGKALKTIAAASPQGPNTISVSGSCKENLLIQSIDRVTLITRNSASITDTSNGNLPVIDIEDSRSIYVQGFTIGGGLEGIRCALASTCYLTENTVEGSLGQEGVAVITGSHAVLNSNTIENNTQRGMTINNGSQVFSYSDTVQGNVYQGVVVNSGGYLNANNCTIQNNGSGGAPGVHANDRSTLRLISCTISNNGADGVLLLGSSLARFNAYYGPTTISGNAGNGVTVGDLSFAGFDPSSITGNLSGTDVLCMPQFSATRGAQTNIGGGATNCVEP